MIGQKLGSFRIEAKLGTGAMGTVYRAVQETRNRVAAIKVITGEQSLKGNAAGRFQRESDILQQFRHPNIVRFLAVGRSQGILYFAMEYVPGGTLEQLLEQRAFLPWREAVEMALQICDALHYAHQHGVVHRDLKPSNLMVTEAGQVKLTDFGIAKDLDATALTATGRTLGTAAYMAPEQIRGTPEVSHKTDLYSLGCVLYQMLTGFPPFSGKTAVVLMHNHLNQSPPRPSAKNPDMPIALDNLVISLMAKDPAQRPWDAEAVRHTLTELKEKADRGESVPMVFAKVDVPTRLGGPATIPPDGPTVSATKVRKGKPRRRPPGDSLPVSPGTIGLVAAGVVLAALLAYTQWPLSKEYLFRHAQELMNSSKREDWGLAQREYIDELRQRFPDYRREEVDGWIDKYALDRAEGRAYVLEHPSQLPSTRPHGEAEELFLENYKFGLEAAKLGQESLLLQKWGAMAEALEGLRGSAKAERDRLDLRGWTLLARERAEGVKGLLAKRRRDALARMELAAAAERSGEAETAEGLYRAVVEEYGRNPELAEIVTLARAKLPGRDDGPETPKSGEATGEPPEAGAGARIRPRD